MTTSIDLGEISVDVILKDIKNVHLSVHPPHGRVRLAAPKRTSIDSLRLYAISRLDWIKRQRRKLQEQERETPREYLERESHYVWGKRFLLTIEEIDAPPAIQQRHRRLLMQVRPNSDQAKRRQVLEDWYRGLVKVAAEELIEKWEPKIGVDVAGYYVRRMKTRWGSCNHHAQTIRLNTDLARKPPECLEYIVAHEMIHILEPTHNDRFQKLMTQHMPDWKQRRQILNRLPVRHEDWGY